MNKQEALNILHITEEDFFNNKILKVFNGVAGSAKSTAAAILLQLTDSYARYTSTHRLKNDAIMRFGGDTFTIAGGLFNTEDGIFFASEKEIHYKNILIDEALQTDGRLFTLLKKLVGKVNIIVCTDSKQMLPPVAEGSILKQFNEFCNLDFVKKIDLDHSLRAVNEISQEMYNDCYKEADNGKFDLYDRYKLSMNWCWLDDISYSKDNAYICHSNELEDILYKKYKLYDRYDLDLLPKGGIASKNIEDLNVENYNILSQKEALRTKLRSYFQISNVGSVTRYQGSEVQVGHKLYFLVNPNDIVGNREFYTMITRAKDVNDITLVFTRPEKKKEPFTQFFGHPVLKPKALKITDDTVIPRCDGKTIEAVREESKTAEKPIKEDELQKPYIDELLLDASRKDGVYYNILINNGKVVKEYTSEESKKPKTSLYSLLNKSQGTSFDCMEDFLRAYEKMSILYKREIHKNIDTIITPQTFDYQFNHTKNFMYSAGIDVYSAYPTAFKYGKIYDGRFFESFEEVSENDFWKEEDKYVGFFFNNSFYGQKGMIITDALVKTMREYDKEFEAFYIGRSPVLKNAKFVDYLYKKVYKSYEDKKFVRDNIRYGWMQKPFLDKIYTSDDKKEWFYGVNESQRYELLMCCVQSDMFNFIIKCKQIIYGNLQEGVCQVDCLYFNKELWTEEVKEEINKIRGNVDYRIFENKKQGKTSEKPIIYKTYEELKSKEDIEKKRSHHKKKPL